MNAPERRCALLFALQIAVCSFSCKPDPDAETPNPSEPAAGDSSGSHPGGQPSALSPTARNNKSSLLIGKWLRAPDGGVDDISGDYQFFTTYKEDGTLEFSMLIADEGVILAGEGTWELDSRWLRSTITSSTDNDLARPGTEIEVDVLKLTEETFRYRARGQAAILESKVPEG